MNEISEKNERPAAPPRMSKVESAFIVFVLVAAFVAEGALTSYKNFQGGAQSIYRQEQEAVAKFKESEDYILRANRLKSELDKLETSTKAKETRNRIAAAIKAEKVELYSGEIRKDTEEARTLRVEFDAWVEKELAPLRAQFAEKRTRASEKSFVGFVSGVSFSWFVPLLVIALGYLSTRQADAWRWILLSLSFLPQFASSQMAYDGAMLKFGQQQALAGTIAAMFFFCLPFLYHYGIIALRSKRAFCVEENSGDEQTIDRRAAKKSNHGKITHHTETMTLEFDLTEQGYAQAIKHVAEEMNAGNGKGLFSQVLKRFEPLGANKASLSRAIRRARSGEDVHVGLKNFHGTKRNQNETRLELK